MFYSYYVICIRYIMLILSIAEPWRHEAMFSLLAYCHPQHDSILFWLQLIIFKLVFERL